MPARFSLAAMGSSTPSGATFIIQENCEGTGTPAGWTNSPGTGQNWDYTVVPLEAAQSLYLPTVGLQVGTRTDYPGALTYSEIWWYILLRATNGTAPAAGTNFAALSGSSTIGFAFTTALKMKIGAATVTANSIVIDTTYHVWGHYIKGTGANAVLDIGFSTNGVRPTSGGNFASLSNGTDTVDASRIVLGSNSVNMGMDLIIDKIRVATTQIGDNGT